MNKKMVTTFLRKTHFLRATDEKHCANNRLHPRGYTADLGEERVNKA